MSQKPQFIVKKSYKNGHVKICTNLKCRGWNTGDDSVRLEGSSDLTTTQARELAAALISEADKVDARVAANAKHEENRRKYREREIAAGRMVILGKL